MKQLLFIFLSMVLLSCDGKKPAVIGETAWQQKINADYKDASKSPLKAKDLRTFNGLEFFPFDSVYVVNAKFKPTPDTPWFSMKTTTDRVSKERVYGVASFELNGKSFQLNVYQGEEDLNSEDRKIELFLPFLDDTNGESSYAGGRYINLAIPTNDTIQIDFNKAYNPYCVYNEKYSCPIVPRENYLSTEIKAGMMNFKKGDN